MACMAWRFRCRRWAARARRRCQRESTPTLAELRDELYVATWKDQREGQEDKKNDLVSEIFAYKHEKGPITSLADDRVTVKEVGTVLYYALAHRKIGAALFFMKRRDRKLLTHTFGKDKSVKSCMSVLIKNGASDLMKEYLWHLKATCGEDYKQFMRKPIGPFHLPPIHYVVVLRNIKSQEKRDLIKVLHEYDPECVDLPEEDGTKKRPIHYAMRDPRNRDEELIKYLLKLKASPFLTDDKKESALGYALNPYDVKYVDLLLQDKISLAGVEDLCKTQSQAVLENLLIHVIKKKLFDIAEELLKFNTYFHACNAGETVWSSALPKRAVVQEAEEQRADVQEADEQEADEQAADEQEQEHVLENVLRLYEKYGSRQDAQKALQLEYFESPFHACARTGDHETLKKLIKSASTTADINIVDQELQGEEAKEFVLLLDVNCKDSKGNTPLHICLSSGKFKVMEILLLEGANHQEVNNMGETALHVCARSPHCGVSVLEKLLAQGGQSQVYANQKDHYGNTALHNATRAGRREFVERLVQHGAELLLNEEEGTPLHIAAAKGNESLLRRMLALYDIKPKESAEAFRVEEGSSQAASTNADSVLQSKRSDGKTLLHICVRDGYTAIVDTLIRSGADLTAQDKLGNTALHDVALGIASNKALVPALLDVFEMIMGHAVNWMCFHKTKEWPSNRDEDKLMKTKAAQYLLEKIPNNDGYNVVQYATLTGSNQLLRHIYNMEGVYIFYDNKDCIFDVTNLTPETSSEDRNTNAFEGYKCFGRRLGVSTNKPNTLAVTREDSNTALTEKLGQIDRETESKQNSLHSCLKIIVDLDDTDLATTLLDSSPIKYLILNYWTVYRFVYVIGLVIHIVSMIALTAFPTQDVRLLWRNKTRNSYEPDKQYAALLVWPSFIFFFYATQLVILLYTYCKNYERETKRHKRVNWEKLKQNQHLARMLTSRSKASGSRNQVHPNTETQAPESTPEKKYFYCTALQDFLQPPRGIFETIDFMSDILSPKSVLIQTTLELIQKPFGFLYNFASAAISHFSLTLGMIFFLLVVMWYSHYLSADKNQVYYLAPALILGWLQTISFARGFESVNVFVIMLKYIILRDIITIMFIYIFFLLGFASAFQALFQIARDVSKVHPTIWHVLYATFNLMIGLDVVVDEDTDDEYNENDGNSVYLRITVVIYVVFSTIILLNILIAKMSDTYREVRIREGTNWRVESVRQAMVYEKSIPFIGQAFRDMRRKRSHFPIYHKRSRIFLRIPISKVDIKQSDVKSHMYHHISKIENKIILLENRVMKLSKK